MTMASDTQILPSNSNIVGIDLGTTYSSIAVVKDGKPELIPDKLFGERLIESVVFYNPENNDVSVGKYAEEWAVKEISNFIYDTKRLMGRKYDDIYVQDIIKKKKYRYKLVRGKGQNVAIEIKQNKKIIQKLPEEIAAEILKYLKDSASQYLDEPITKAVISVPAHFSNAQRKATKEAARLAGLNVLKLITEPVAAAICYSINRLSVNSTLLVFDFGGGTLDVSVVDLYNKQFKVRGIEGDSFLGGRDFDENLQAHLCSKLLDNTNSNSWDSNMQRHFLRVKHACTRLKKMLSVSQQAIFNLDHFGNNKETSLPLVVSRQEFELLNSDLFSRAIELVKLCLLDLEISKSIIYQVILVGGSSRIPKIEALLGEYFGQNKIKVNTNRDEAISLGAAIQAAILNTNEPTLLEVFKVTEVAPLSIGIDSFGNRMLYGIKKNNPLPAKSTIKTITTQNDQPIFFLRIFEGERKNSKYNSLLAEVEIKNLPKGKAGSVKMETTFSLDEDGILTVESCVKSNNQKSNVVINLKENRLSENRVKNSLNEALRYKTEDLLFCKYMGYLGHALKYCHGILYDVPLIDCANERKQVTDFCNNFINVFSKNKLKDNIDNKLFENLQCSFLSLKNYLDVIMKKYKK